MSFSDPHETDRVTHGGLDYAELRELGLNPDAVLDFSVNVNPFGPSPRVRETLAWVDIARYPDREALALREALAEYHGLELNQIIVGNGAAELIWLAGLAFVHRGDPALILEPTFGEYARVVNLRRGVLHRWRARPAADFAWDPKAIDQALARLRPRVCFLCNPNNPTGQVVSQAHLAHWADAHPRTLFVVDEAYLPFVPDTPSAINLARPNILVLRSMTKNYALAGLRLGYALGPRPLIEALARFRPPWSVNAFAQAAGLAALADEAHRQRTLTVLRRECAMFRLQLKRLGLTPLPSATHFFLIEVGDGAAFRRRLLPKGILVRDAASFGLPAYVRLATRRPEENQRLLQALTTFEHASKTPRNNV
ncbi:MAG: histidinol-phosphate aminotransferase family protein [Chloroflexi bacterium]|nr:histidinol-phosphate aminotransferase family protein [Chloroflexota bacterium]